MSVYVSPTRKKHFAGLDSIRAVAAISVVLYHFTNGGLPKLVIPELKGVFSRGYLGVEIFFVISGFIIPYSMYGKYFDINKFFPYMKKRLIRINPPAYAAMGMVVLQWFLIDKFINHNDFYLNEITVYRIFHNFLFTIPFTNYKWVIGVFWTLAIEFQFYILMGLLYKYMFEGKHIYFFLLIYFMTFAIQGLGFIDVETFFKYSSLFAMGGVSLFMFHDKIKMVEYVMLIICLFFVAFLINDIYVASVGVFTAVIILVMNSKVYGLNFIGRISYSLYLIHMVVGTTIEFLLTKFIAPDSNIIKVLMILMVLGLTIFFAYIFNLFIEKPMIALASADSKR